jgi:predicted secreted protein
MTPKLVDTICLKNNSTIQFSYTLMYIQKTNLRKVQEIELPKNETIVGPFGKNSWAGCGRWAANWIGFL